MQILEIPFLFNRTGYERRARNGWSMQVSAMTLLRVEDVSSSRAPVVARCRYHGQHLDPERLGDGRGTQWTDAILETDYRMLDGQLLRRAVADRDFLLGTGKSLDMARASRQVLEAWSRDPGTVGPGTAQVAMHQIRHAIASGARLLMPMLPGRRPANMHYVHTEEDDLAQRPRNGHDDRAARYRQAAAELVGRMAFIDHALYVPSWGPALVLEGVRDGAYLACARPEAAWIGNDTLSSAHLAHDCPTAQVWAQRNGGFAGYEGEVEILDSEAFGMHPDELAARAEACHACENSAAHELAERRSPAGLRAVADVMEALDSDGPRTEDLLQALSDFAVAWNAAVPEDSPLRWRSEGAAILAERAQARQAAAPALRLAQ